MSAGPLTGKARGRPAASSLGILVAG